MSVTTFPSVSFAEIIGKRQVWNLPNPGAGNEWSLTLPGGYYYRLLGGSATFTCSAAVGNRNVGVELTDGPNLLGATWTPANATAGAVLQVIYSPGGQWSQVGSGAIWQIMLVASGWWSPAMVIQSSTRGLLAGDAYSSLVLWFEQLELGARGLPMDRHDPTIAEEEELYGIG